jgi:hypothetical protein
MALPWMLATGVTDVIAVSGPGREAQAQAQSPSFMTNRAARLKGDGYRAARAAAVAQLALLERESSCAVGTALATPIRETGQS